LTARQNIKSPGCVVDTIIVKNEIFLFDILIFFALLF
jgi:hypothetical protein